jgi:hypothetical protein
MATVEP